MRERECEVAHTCPTPEDLAQIQARAYLTDLIPNVAGDERCLGIIKDYGLLAVKPTGLPVDLRLDGVDIKDRDLVEERPLAPIDHLSPPSYPPSEARRWPAECRPRANDRCPNAVAI